MDMLSSLMSPETSDYMIQKIGTFTECISDFTHTYKWALLGLGSIVGIYWYIKRHHGFFVKLGIPGPNPGLFGSISDYMSTGIALHDRQLMKKYGRVAGIFHASRPVYMVADADIVRQICVKEFSNFVNRMPKGHFPEDPCMKDAINTIHDEHWRFIRSILSPTFTSGKIKEMKPLIDKCVESLVKNMGKTSGEGENSVKMKDLFAQYTMDVIATTAFGVEADCQADPDNPFMTNAKKLLKPNKKIIIMLALCMTIPYMSKIMTFFGWRFMEKSVADFFVGIIYGAIEQRQKNDVVRKDFLQLMLNSHQLEADTDEEDADSKLEFDASKRRGLVQSEVLGNALIFIIAGFETTSSALAYVAYNLATNPMCQEKLLKEIDSTLEGEMPTYENINEMKYLEYVFLETLRQYPSAVRTSRVGKEDITINGILFKKGCDIHIPILAIHHDPEYWDDPETFNPDRFRPENRKPNFNYIYLAFGVGPRNCIGMRLAHIESKMAIIGVLQKYRFKTVPETNIPPVLDLRGMSPKDQMVLGVELR